MPELPEVERARRLIQESCAGYRVDEVMTIEDKIVYDGTDHLEFATELQGRTITGCERKGKQFWMTLSGEGRYPVMHFGMTGMIQLRGQEPTWYRRKVNLGETADSWPPRFYKFVLKLVGPDKSSEPCELAFIDPRRLGRVRLIPDPVLSHPPLSLLGFDPVLSHPTLEEFKELISKKKGSIKGLIMDQAFSAGVGNWVADEVLYQARIHPLCPVPALTETDLTELHRLLREIPLKAIEVNADSALFPPNWLFSWRWDKGKKKPKKKRAGEEDKEEEDTPNGVKFLALPDGRPATITFVTVAGRTSAVVTELQKLPAGIAKKTPKTKAKAKSKGKGRKRKDSDEDSDESELTELEDDAPVPVVKVEVKPRSKRVKVEVEPTPKGVKVQVKPEPLAPEDGRRRSKRIRV